MNYFNSEKFTIVHVQRDDSIYPDNYGNLVWRIEIENDKKEISEALIRTYANNPPTEGQTMTGFIESKYERSLGPIPDNPPDVGPKWFIKDTKELRQKEKRRRRKRRKLPKRLQ